MTAFQSSMSRRAFVGGAAAGALAVPFPVTAFSTAGAARKDWWKGEYRILQTNLREIDVRQDPVRIARDVRAFGASAIVSNIGGIVAFYPTKLQFQYRNPYLKGDFVGRMVEAAHAEGLAYIGRFDLSKAMKPVFDAHPDWFMRNRDGSAREYAGTYQACPSGGWAQDYAFRIFEEGLRRYAVDGLFFNMVGFTRTDYSNVDHGICVCDNCKRRFRDMYGLDLPATDGPDDPNWAAYSQFQTRTLAALAKRNVDLVRQIRPDAALMDFMSGDIARGEVQRRVDRPPPEWPYAMGEQVRWVTGVMPDRPFSATSAAHIDYPWRLTTESAANHMLRFAQALGTGGKLDLYLMGTLADQEDPTWLQPVSQLFKWHAANEGAYAGLRPAARVGLYSGGFVFTGGKAGTFDAQRGAYEALVGLRLPFVSVDAGRLEFSGASLLRDLDVLLLPDVQRMSDAQAKALDAFVAAGGLLIATGKTGALDGKGAIRGRVAMASSPVEAFGEEANALGWSLDDNSARLDFGGANIPLDGTYFRVRARAGAETLIPFAPDHPFGPPEFTYPKPGKAARRDPGVLARRHGKGVSVHIPWQPEILYYRLGLDAHRDLFGALIERFAAPAPCRLKGTGPVELTAQRQSGTGALMFHVINYAGQRNTSYRTPPSIHGLELGVRDAGAAQAQMMRAGTSVAGRRGKDGYMWFNLPAVGYFEAIRILPG